MKHYLLYKTTNIKTGQYYIGIHQTNNIEDGYLGSGTVIHRVIKKYGTQSFQRTILGSFETRQEMIKAERQIVTEQIVNDPKCYNLTLGGGSGWYYVNNGPNRQQIINKMKNTKNSNGDNVGTKNPMFGRKHTEQVKQRISILNSGRLVGDKNPSKRPEVREKLKQTKLGLNNPRGCIWKLISPQGQETIINGGIKRYFEQIGFSYISFSKEIDGIKYSTRHKDWELIKLNKEGQLYDNDSR